MDNRFIPRAVVDDIRKGGDTKRFAKSGYKLLEGWSYRNMWWNTHNEHGAFTARGVHGQTIYIDPEAEMVIAPLCVTSSSRQRRQSIQRLLPAYHALAKLLMSK